MEKELTESQIKALTILKDTGYMKPVSARYIADKMWGETHIGLFTKHSNQGNGACVGKAAWLCAGSYMGRLRKKGWVDVRYNPSRYYLTDKGKKVLKDIQNKLVKAKK